MTATDARATSPPHAVDELLRSLREPAVAARVDPDVVRTALATLPHDDQQLLWDVHVHGRGVEAIAHERAAHARAVRLRLRRAEERLAAGFAAAHVRSCPPACLETRSALQDYVRHALGARRRNGLEGHLFSCQDCMRAFVDVRQAAWSLRDAAPLLLAGASGLGAAGPVVVGVGGAATSGLGLLGWFGSLGAAFGAAWDGVVRGLRQLGRAGTAAVTAAVVTVVMAAGALPVVLGDEPAPSQAASRPPVAGESPGAVEPVEPAAPTPAPTPLAPTPAPTPVAPTPVAPTSAPTPAAPTPAAPAAPAPAPEPAPVPEAQPAAVPEAPPVAAPAPVAAPVPEPAPVVPPAPTPEPPAPAPPTPAPPVVVDVALALDGPGRYQVTAGENADVVAVAGEGRAKVWQGRDGSWHVVARGKGSGTVTVTVSGPAGTAPGAALVRVSAP